MSLTVPLCTDLVRRPVLVEKADPDGFSTWLRKRRPAAENRIPYFVRWVEAFLRFRVMRP